MNRLETCRLDILLPAKLAHDQQQLPMQFAPLAHAQVGKKALTAPVAQFRLGQVRVRQRVRVPQVQHADKIGFGIDERRMRQIGRLARIGRALARILDTQEGDQDQQLAHRIQLVRFDQHARQGNVDRQPRHVASSHRQPLVLVDRIEFGEAPVAIADCAHSRRFDERKLFHIAKFQAQHAQNHASQRRAQDFRVGIARPRGEIVFAVQAHTHARADASAAALALFRGSLRDRLDMQTFELIALDVALDPRGAGVDHVADARHRQRGLGNIRRQHDAPLRTRLEYAVLLGGRQARV